MRRRYVRMFLAIAFVLALVATASVLTIACGGGGSVTTVASSLPATTAPPSTGSSGPVTTSLSGTTSPAGSSTTASGPATTSMPASASDYTILAANDLGMHCIQPDYSAMMILPPANFLHVQVFKKGGEEARLVTSGITVEYAVQNLGDPSAHTNFWQYAKDYGFNVAPGVGITGNGLSGTLTLSKDGTFWEAIALPVVPYDAQGTFNAYPTCEVTVKDSSGTVVAVQPVVVLPVSDEMHCDNCHEKTNTFASILGVHDTLSNTTLADDLAKGTPHACNECHADPVLNAAGTAGVKSLSEAIHGYHASKMTTMNTLEVSCYNCHPGETTQCLRGAMAAAGLTCDDSKCHGPIDNVAATIAQGRQPWLNEPDCGNCHSNASNPNTLYRLSYLANGPEDMNGFILCESCHNGTHAEWKSTSALDNKLPEYLQGAAGPISQCGVCHSGNGKMHGGGDD